MNKTLRLTIGKRHCVMVADLIEASREYQRMRRESGEGASTWPHATVSGGFRISYNGRVWRGTQLFMEAA